MYLLSGETALLFLAWVAQLPLKKAIQYELTTTGWSNETAHKPPRHNHVVGASQSRS